jgi:hypothetical protein
MSVMDAALNVAEDFAGGASALARAIDKNHWTFLHELSGTGTAKLGLLTALKMTRRTGDLRILLAFAAEFGQMCLPLPESLAQSGDECMTALSAVMRESSDVCQELCKALGTDGDINDNELADIRREGGELMAAVQKLLVTAQCRNLASKSKRIGGAE